MPFSISFTNMSTDLLTGPGERGREGGNQMALMAKNELDIFAKYKLANLKIKIQLALLVPRRR